MEKIFAEAVTQPDDEKKADIQLNELLDNPDHAFLSTIAGNAALIESADSAVEALDIAKSLIRERERRTFVFLPAHIPGVEYGELDHTGALLTLQDIKQHELEIGVGGDAVVVVAETEMHDGTYDVCYKFAKQEETPRGRNGMETELDLQVEFYSVLSSVTDLRIGVPSPYYYSALGHSKMIAMEKLTARSIDDLRRGKGSMPHWVTEQHIHEFCQELKRAIAVCHENNLYHRDLHFGNIMFTQSPTEVQKLGYIIDFGLSGHGLAGLDPYRKETNTEVFTYGDDYGRINAVEDELMRLIQRKV